MNKDKALLAIERGLGGDVTWHFTCDILFADERSNTAVYRK